ncbi:hypothetical protein [uncultured Helicobacter sp.]|uniref:hypothetical protein n=1 Tax=uncultured Helicobacter sp. TaxID=175537 RepID=UPI00374F5D70
MPGKPSVESRTDSESKKSLESGFTNSESSFKDSHIDSKSEIIDSESATYRILTKACPGNSRIVRKICLFCE